MWLLPVPFNEKKKNFTFKCSMLMCPLPDRQKSLMIENKSSAALNEPGMAKVYWTSKERAIASESDNLVASWFLSIRASALHLKLLFPFLKLKSAVKNSQRETSIKFIFFASNASNLKKIPNINEIKQVKYTRWKMELTCSYEIMPKACHKI